MSKKQGIILSIIVIAVVILAYLSTQEECFKWASICTAIVEGLALTSNYLVEQVNGKQANNGEQVNENQDNKVEKKNDFLLSVICGGIVAVTVLSLLLFFFADSDDGVIVTDMKLQQSTTTSTESSESPDKELSTHEHSTVNIVTENRIEATCTNSGSYELIECCDCGEELKRETVPIKALGHDFVKRITKPTCNEAGFTTFVCSRCKDMYEGENVEALGHDYVEGICSRCDAISPDYEVLIISKANELINVGNYYEASNLVSNAMNIIQSKNLQDIYNNLKKVLADLEKSVIYTAKATEFITYTGTITGDDEKDMYLLTAPTSGEYRFDLSEMAKGFQIQLVILNSLGYQVGCVLGSNCGVTCTLEEGETYSIEVRSYYKTGEYVLNIGQQKDTVNITNKEIVYDSIEYVEQCNMYTFAPAIDGSYRFDLLDVVSNLQFGLYIYNSLGYKVGGYIGVGNDNGVTVELEANEVYTIKVSQYLKLGNYTLAIGKQLAPMEITGNEVILGDITYVDQDNIYIYKPTASGEYNFSLYNMVPGFQVEFFIYDSLGYKAGGYVGATNKSVITADLTAGEVYTIHVTQYVKTGSYDISIIQ